MITVRTANEKDIPKIREIYLEVYGTGYPHQDFYDENWLKRSVFSDDILMLVAVEDESGKILGTASVVFDIGTHSDLIAEFGRLAVHPDARTQGIGTLLLEKRIEAIRNRLHLGMIVARVVHPYAQKISIKHQFVPVGFIPLKHCFADKRESLALLVRYFGDALRLRKNNPRVLPEVYPLADRAMHNLSIQSDLVVDEESSPYPHNNDFSLEELTAEGLPPLLRIERGRVHNREIFGHMRLEYGFFKLQLGKAKYLLARDNHTLAGAIGYTLDPVEHLVRVFELITSTDQAIWFLLSELEKKCREDWGIQYVEIDVSAHAPRMQRTLLGLNFLPIAYIPAMVFHDVERLDIIRMVRLNISPELGSVNLTPSVQSISDLVMRNFILRDVAPRITQVASEIPLFSGLNDEQLNRLASACSVSEFQEKEQIFAEKGKPENMYIILDGTISIRMGNPTATVGSVKKGETLGELSLLSARNHSATAVAETRVEAAVLNHLDLSKLTRQRPDIGMTIYQNLAIGLGEKLLRSDHSLRDQMMNKTLNRKKSRPRA